MNQNGSLIMINPWHTDEYYNRLKMQRDGSYDVKAKLEEIKDPFELHPRTYQFIPTYIEASQKAQSGEIYCWGCGSPHIVKNGHKYKTKEKYKDIFSFVCRDCRLTFSYKMSHDIYTKFKGVAMINSGANFKKLKKGKLQNYDEF